VLSADPKLLSDALLEVAHRRSVTGITKLLPFAEIRARLRDRSSIKEARRMQFEIPEDAHVYIVIGKPATAKVCAVDPGAAGTLLAVPGDAAAGRPAPRSGRLLLKGGLGLMLLAGSFAVGQHFGSSPHAPELARTAAALPRPALSTEQHAFSDRPQPREAPAQPAGQVTADFQRLLQQPPTVIPPPGQTVAPETPGKNPFGLEN
jgi:hypothetical protein